jgi:hypothetical protein
MSGNATYQDLVVSSDNNFRVADKSGSYLTEQARIETQIADTSDECVEVC